MFSASDATFRQVRARAKVLAREDREMRAALVRLRHDTGLRQREVAERMGVSQQAVNKLERYDADPKLSTLQRYANAVGAIIEHRVEPDRGQSLRLADRTSWSPADSRSPRSVPASRPTAIFRVVEGWVASPVRDRELVS
ncbi:helix-turn-helix protein [Rathayibacter sp. PhB152]|uniref:helix-turn-helix domain-containing protein n=1 Tax=Rathayibacter sp. PhB152 TaxID=2485190 RepID=UPI000F4BC419|nr:helix-turn-helix transcriptional regulator [Rathayibacter sp. PhB152]ROQ52629.1 helix-turn-helix protein [Rathayibacter sp. PhB152]